MEDPVIYTFPEADHLDRQFKLLPLSENIHYSTHKVHRHNYYELFFFDQGGGTHLIDFEHYPIDSGTLHMVRPGALHLVKRKSGSSGFVLLFTQEFLYSLVDFTPATHHMLWSEQLTYQLKTAEIQFVQACLQQMQDETEKNRPERNIVIASFLHMIFIMMYRIGQSTTSEPPPLIARFFQILEENFNKNISADDYGQGLQCSTKKLNKVLSDAGYTSVLQQIIKRRVLEAQRLLVHTPLSVKEIAFHIGYEDPDYFGRVFKQQTDTTPLSFRKVNSKI